MLHYENLHFYFRLGLKLKKQIVYYISIKFNTKESIKAEKMVAKMEIVAQVNEQCFIW